jgi:hypothetical protein
VLDIETEAKEKNIVARCMVCHDAITSSHYSRGPDDDMMASQKHTKSTSPSYNIDATSMEEGPVMATIDVSIVASYIDDIDRLLEQLRQARMDILAVSFADESNAIRHDIVMLRGTKLCASDGLDDGSRGSDEGSDEGPDDGSKEEPMEASDKAGADDNDEEQTAIMARLFEDQDARAKSRIDLLARVDDSTETLETLKQELARCLSAPDGIPIARWKAIERRWIDVMGRPLPQSAEWVGRRRLIKLVDHSIKMTWGWPRPVSSYEGIVDKIRLPHIMLVANESIQTDEMYAVIVPKEDADKQMMLMDAWIRTDGIVMAIYNDGYLGSYLVTFGEAMQIARIQNVRRLLKRAQGMSFVVSAFMLDDKHLMLSLSCGNKYMVDTTTNTLTFVGQGFLGKRYKGGYIRITTFKGIDVVNFYNAQNVYEKQFRTPLLNYMHTSQPLQVWADTNDDIWVCHGRALIKIPLTNKLMNAPDGASRTTPDGRYFFSIEASSVVAAKSLTVYSESSHKKHCFQNQREIPQFDFRGVATVFDRLDYCLYIL